MLHTTVDTDPLGGDLLKVLLAFGLQVAIVFQPFKLPPHNPSNFITDRDKLGHRTGWLKGRHMSSKKATKTNNVHLKCLKDSFCMFICSL